MTELIINEPDRVILRGELGEEAVFGIVYSLTEGYEEFSRLFDLDNKDYPVDGDYYQGLELWRIITRKSDGRQFGFKYWDSPGNDNYETQVESNGEANGIEYEYTEDCEVIGGEAYVFLPVKPVGLPTFAFEEGSE